MIELVKQWLVQHNKWLLLVGNVVRSDIVRPFLPAGYSGIILYTTRSEACARSLGTTGRLRLLPFNGDESVALILKATDIGEGTASEQTRNAAVELGCLLGGLPLALEHSAACIADRHWTLSAYVEKLRLSRVETLNQGSGPDAVHLNVFDTFRPAMRQLSLPSVALIKIMAHLDHHSIPTKLLTLGIKCSIQNMDKSALGVNIILSPPSSPHIHIPYQHRFRKIAEKLNPMRYRQAKSNRGRRCRKDTIRESLRSLFSDANELETAISSLTATALVYRKESGSFWMHDLVCDLSLEDTHPEEHSILTAYAVTLCFYAFPLIPENHETWEDCEEIATHALVSLSHVSDKQTALTSASNLQFLLGLFYQARGRYNDALQFYKAAAVTFQDILGPEHTQTLTTTNSIANLLDGQGKYEESLQWHQKTLAAREKALGPKHPDTLSTLNNMAASLRKQAKYDKAMQLYVRALAGFEEVFDVEHPDTLSTISNIANVFHEQGNYQTALEWHRRALIGRSKTLGSTHPQTLSTMNNMAISLSSQGRYKEGLQWYHKALDNFERLLGHDHPHTLSVCNSIAIALHDLGEPSEALHWYERALASRQKVLGIENPDTLSSLDNIANVLADLGDHDKAHQNHQSALEGREKVLGHQNPETICTINNIGVSLVSADGVQHPLVLQRFQAALVGFEEILGPEHPFTLTVLYNIGVVHDHYGEYEQTRYWYTRSLAGREKVLGMHPDTVTTLHCLVNLMNREGQSEKASQLYSNTVARLRHSTLSDCSDAARLDMDQVESNLTITETKPDTCLPLCEPFTGDQQILATPRPQFLKTHRLLTWCSNRIQEDMLTEDNKRNSGIRSVGKKKLRVALLVLKREAVYFPRERAGKLASY